MASVGRGKLPRISFRKENSCLLWALHRGVRRIIPVAKRIGSAEAEVVKQEKAPSGLKILVDTKCALHGAELLAAMDAREGRKALGSTYRRYRGKECAKRCIPLEQPQGILGASDGALARACRAKGVSCRSSY